MTHSSRTISAVVLSLTVAVTSTTSQSFGQGTSQQASTPPLKVVSAQRTEEYEMGGTISRIRSNDTDIVLVLTLDSTITNKEWDNVRPDDFYIMAGKDKYPVLVVTMGRSSADASGKVATTYPRVAVFKAPRQQLELTVHFLERPAVKFTADKAIRPSMR